MSLIEYIGKDNGFSSEDLSFSNIRAFRGLYLSAESTKDVITESIEPESPVRGNFKPLVAPINYRAK